MPRVFVTRRLIDGGLAELEQECEVRVWPHALPPTPDEFRRESRDCDAILTMLTDKVDAAFLEATPTLKVVANYAVGFNNIDLDACKSRGVKVGNTPGVLTGATADIAVTLLLAAARRLVESVDDARAGNWATWEPTGYLGADLEGRTLGIVGMGRIAHATARRLRGGWGVDVIYTSRTPKPEADRELAARRVSFGELLQTSDFVSVHADLNPDSRGMFDAAAFAKMKPTAVFVNTSRGPVVDQSALAAALRNGTIAAAGLDVTDPEPLPAGHELYDLRNCIITPHIASATPKTRRVMAEMASRNIFGRAAGGRVAAPARVNPLADRPRRRYQAILPTTPHRTADAPAAAEIRPDLPAHALGRHALARAPRPPRRPRAHRRGVDPVGRGR